MTSTGETPIRVLVENGGAQVDAAVMSSLATAAELRTYPDLVVVPTTTITVNPPTPTVGQQPPPPEHPQLAYVELQPKSKLVESWYVLSLSAIPSIAKVAPSTGAPQAPVGVYAVRFHTGSQPLLTRVLICNKGVGVDKAVFEFSENVRASQGDVQTVVGVEQLGKSCSDVKAGPAPNAATKWIDFSCDKFTATDPWRISVKPGLVSDSDVPVKTFGGALAIEQDLLPQSLPDQGDGCRVWRP